MTQARIYAVAKHVFDRIVTKPDWPEHKDQIAFISICEPDSDFDVDRPALKTAENVHVLYTHDIDYPVKLLGGSTVLPFTEEQAAELVAFVERNAYRKLWLVHCTMGVSRSGAVATFLREYLQIDYEQFCQDNPHIIPNKHILNLLRNERLKADIRRSEG